MKKHTAGLNRNRKCGYSSLIGGLVAGILVSIFSIQAAGQVVIVPNRFRSERRSGKNKGKKEAGKRVRSAPIESAPEAPAGRMSKLAFTLSLPEIADPPANRPEEAEEPVRPEVPLMHSSFNVPVADNRGRVIETRIESTRSFSQQLPGGIGIEMVEVPAGTFLMGADETELESVMRENARNSVRTRDGDRFNEIEWEIPRHQVGVSEMMISRYEITQAQWRAVAGLPKIDIELISDPSRFKGGNRPVENVSWAEAVEFCARLSRLTGRKYRLPTEVEWEYACRAGTSTPFSSGDGLGSDWANFNGRRPYGSNSKGPYREQTVPVGSLGAANAFGLYDMHGNVWEWTLDRGGSGESGASFGMKILRGCGWDSAGIECRSAARRTLDPDHRADNVGFRVVIERAEK